MSDHSTPYHDPPLYCGTCGKQLLDKTSEIRLGFDPFTGEERPPEPHVTKECPERMHDVWVLVGSNWVKP